MSKYRFDDAYEKIYIYDLDQKAYVYFSSYFNVGISASISDKMKEKMTIEYNEYLLLPETYT